MAWDARVVGPRWVPAHLLQIVQMPEWLRGSEGLESSLLPREGPLGILPVFPWRRQQRHGCRRGCAVSLNPLCCLTPVHAGANAFGGALSQRLQKWLMDAALAERRPVKVATGPG